ncbi:MAG TPA: response regulator transcription factor [Candidatus Alistipes avicola]|uniref:Response regulator transcription factor n=1 Tax=Candidatus Alistipes avicola TaxID=2838432 RepID=A0A9D2L273_9BACT|nr:response regulator transcription factor [uncultured Alistipes sp.]HJA98301.1 response regulator transcription factor [Candidatus Alistipes avicola]
MKEKILVVDDERDICEILEFNLLNEGYEVDVAYSAEEALEKLTPEHALILLDVMMGGISGYKLAEKLRREGNTIPIIFLTAKDTENDMLTGFSVGGDDYISKPFSIKEVSARVKAVLKRSATQQEDRRECLVMNDLNIDFNAKELTIAGRVVSLTKTEFEIFALMAKNPTRVFSREDIIERLWKDAPYVTERTVDVHITRLRKKLGDHASLITSRPGYGYRFNLKEE